MELFFTIVHVGCFHSKMKQACSRQCGVHLDLLSPQLFESDVKCLVKPNENFSNYWGDVLPGISDVTLRSTGGLLVAVYVAINYPRDPTLQSDTVGLVSEFWLIFLCLLLMTLSSPHPCCFQTAFLALLLFTVLFYNLSELTAMVHQ